MGSGERQYTHSGSYMNTVCGGRGGGGGGGTGQLLCVCERESEDSSVCVWPSTLPDADLSWLRGHPHLIKSISTIT